MTWPLVPVDGKTSDWPRKIAQAINWLIGQVSSLSERLDNVGGAKDELNSTTTPLGAGGTYTGEWVANNDSQIAFSVSADVYGEPRLEFALDALGAVKVLSKPYQLFPNDPDFDALVKMPGRYHRIVYENGPTAQTQFNLLCSTAPNGLFPFAENPRKQPVGYAFSTGLVESPVSEEYAILIDLSDRDNFHHYYTKSLIIDAGNFFIDRSANAEGQVQAGVIVEIDATEATIEFIQGVSFSGSSERDFPRDRDPQDPIRLTQENGELTAFTSKFRLTTTAVNTATTLDSSSPNAPAVTPAVGDYILRYTRTNGSYTAAVSGQYRGSPSP